MSIEKRLARAIHKSGRTDPESIARYLVKRGWRDTEKRPKVQQVTVIPAPTIPQAMQTPMTQLPDMRSLPIDFKQQRFLR